jgi:hypothetical protein
VKESNTNYLSRDYFEKEMELAQNLQPNISEIEESNTDYLSRDYYKKYYQGLPTNISSMEESNADHPGCDYVEYPPTTMCHQKYYQRSKKQLSWAQKFKRKYSKKTHSQKKVSPQRFERRQPKKTHIHRRK